MRTLVLDTECFHGYWLLSLKDVATRERWVFEVYADHPLDKAGVIALMQRNRLVSFNGNRYDIPMIVYAITGASTEQLKRASDWIIQKNAQPWVFEEKFQVRMPRRLDHVDLFEVAPGVASLKTYGGKMHSKRIEDLPLGVNETVDTPELREQVVRYNDNDLDTTIDLWNWLQLQMALRERMSADYGMDLRSKSDAQIAEAIIKARVTAVTGLPPIKPGVPDNPHFRFVPPPWLRFTTPELKELLETVVKADFQVSSGGVIQMPDELAKLNIVIGTSTYRMGIGGLHSSEKSVTRRSSAHKRLWDVDVASYYPNLILAGGWAPAHMGEAFQRVYKALVERRLALKRAGDKTGADSLKTAVNGTFGKLGSVWSTLYSPNLLIQTTVSGQLTLLMLIEMLQTWGCPVLSANTDGVLVEVDSLNELLFDDAIVDWENLTGLETERVEYRMICSRDVNNYIALKADGGYKLKGAYAPPVIVGPSWPNPHGKVCVDAVLNFLILGLDIRWYIMSQRDIRDFVSVRTVRGGAVKDGEYLGRTARWYYSDAVDGCIQYKVNGYKVPETDGARPCMVLPDELPGDIDYEWYVAKCHSILEEVGYANP